MIGDNEKGAISIQISVFGIHCPRRSVCSGRVFPIAVTQIIEEWKV